MFKNKRYVTRGVTERIELVHQLILWELIDSLTIEKDYLQIFRLSWNDGKLTITHSQEVPPYKKVHIYTWKIPVKTEKTEILEGLKMNKEIISAIVTVVVTVAVKIAEAKINKGGNNK